MSASAVSMGGSFNPSPALLMAQYRERAPARGLVPSGSLLDLFSLLRFRNTSPSVRMVATAPANQAVVSRPLPRVKVAKSTRDLVVALRSRGMPISGIAEMVGVQRKTIYSWINENVVADSRNHDRLQAISNLLDKEPPGSLQFLTRHWERLLPGGGTLKDALAAERLDVERTLTALEWLRPAVLRSIKQSGHHDVSGDTTCPASSLTEYLEAVTA